MTDPKPIDPPNVTFQVRDGDSKRRGEAFRTRREDVGLSQADLGALAAVHRGTIRNFEMGKPVEERTLRNVAIALGCVHHDDTLHPILTAGTTRAVTRAILTLDGDDQNTAAGWLYAAITAVDTGRPLPSIHSSAGQLIAANLSHGALADLHNELHPNTPAPAPTPAGPLAELHLILQSGLPAHTQTALVAHAQQRRASMEAALLAEMRLLVEQIRTHTKSARAELG